MTRFITVCFISLLSGGGAFAGTGTCTATDGAIIDGGKCCKALTGQFAPCTCDESGTEGGGATVTCSHDTIADGSTATINKAISRILLGLQIIEQPESDLRDLKY